MRKSKFYIISGIVIFVVLFFIAGSEFKIKNFCKNSVYRIVRPGSEVNFNKREEIKNEDIENAESQLIRNFDFLRQRSDLKENAIKADATNIVRRIAKISDGREDFLHYIDEFCSVLSEAPYDFEYEEGKPTSILGMEDVRTTVNHFVGLMEKLDSREEIDKLFSLTRSLNEYFKSIMDDESTIFHVESGYDEVFAILRLLTDETDLIDIKGGIPTVVNTVNWILNESEFKERNKFDVAVAFLETLYVNKSSIQQLVSKLSIHGESIMTEDEFFRHIGLNTTAVGKITDSDKTIAKAWLNRTFGFLNDGFGSGPTDIKLESDAANIIGRIAEISGTKRKFFYYIDTLCSVFSESPYGFQWDGETEPSIFDGMAKDRAALFEFINLMERVKERPCIDKLFELAIDLHGCCKEAESYRRIFNLAKRITWDTPLMEVESVVIEREERDVFNALIDKGIWILSDEQGLTNEQKFKVLTGFLEKIREIGRSFYAQQPVKIEYFNESSDYETRVSQFRLIIEKIYNMSIYDIREFIKR